MRPVAHLPRPHRPGVFGPERARVAVEDRGPKDPGRAGRAWRRQGELGGGGGGGEERGWAGGVTSRLL